MSESPPTPAAGPPTALDIIPDMLSTVTQFVSSRWDSSFETTLECWSKCIKFDLQLLYLLVLHHAGSLQREINSNSWCVSHVIKGQFIFYHTGNFVRRTIYHLALWGLNAHTQLSDLDVSCPWCCNKILACSEKTFSAKRTLPCVII